MKLSQFNLNKESNSPLKASMMVQFPIKYNNRDCLFNIEVKYFEKNDGSSWFGYPTSQWTNAQGEKKYKWLAFFDAKDKEIFEKDLKPLVDEKLNEVPF